MCPAAFAPGGDQRPTRLCVVGSVNMDQFFTVEALPRPGETVLASSATTAPGGKGGNQAVAAARAGAIVQFVGAVGADAAGARLRGHLRDNGVGLPEGKVGSGLGTQIVRTLIQGELGGTIDWHTLMGSGTEVTIDVPMTWMKKASAQAG